MDEDLMFKQGDMRFVSRVACGVGRSGMGRVTGANRESGDCRGLTLMKIKTLTTGNRVSKGGSARAPCRLFAIYIWWMEWGGIFCLERGCP
ncbi:MAG: hypothetical protein JWR26_2912 [Pedosphaera sp.]|nr:hypothetical protein [Pedosphaera sp.]